VNHQPKLPSGSFSGVTQWPAPPYSHHPAPEHVRVYPCIRLCHKTHERLGFLVLEDVAAQGLGITSWLLHWKCVGLLNCTSELRKTGNPDVLCRLQYRVCRCCISIFLYMCTVTDVAVVSLNLHQLHVPVSHDLSCAVSQHSILHR